MSSVVKDGDLGSLCRPYRAPGSAPVKPRADALGYSLAPLRGSGVGGYPAKGVVCRIGFGFGT